jgi:hypothetical protein
MTQRKKTSKMFLRIVISGIRGIRDLCESPFIRAIRAWHSSAICATCLSKIFKAKGKLE